MKKKMKDNIFNKISKYQHKEHRNDSKIEELERKQNQVRCPSCGCLWDSHYEVAVCPCMDNAE